MLLRHLKHAHILKKTSDGIESFWIFFFVFLSYWRGKANKSLELLDNCKVSKKAFSSKGHVSSLYKYVFIVLCCSFLRKYFKFWISGFILLGGSQSYDAWWNIHLQGKEEGSRVNFVGGLGRPPCVFCCFGVGQIRKREPTDLEKMGCWMQFTLTERPPLLQASGELCCWPYTAWERCARLRHHQWFSLPQSTLSLSAPTANRCCGFSSGTWFPGKPFHIGFAQLKFGEIQPRLAGKTLRQAYMHKDFFADTRIQKEF